MKNSYKVALLAALGLASVSARAYTSGDLLVGIYDPTVANTMVYDLGSFSSLVNGETWTATQMGLSGAGFNATLGGPTVFGVFGATTAGNSSVLHTEYLSTAGRTPNPVADYFTDFASFRSPLLTLANNQGAQAVNGGTDFAFSLGLGNGGLTDALGYNPSTSVSGSASFWAAPDDGSAPTPSGFFTLNSSTETLTYVVPEPATVSLFAGAGLLLVALRRKQA